MSAMSKQIGIITTCESGVDLIVEWRIENFFTLSERNGAENWSPEFSFCGVRWYLRIFPNGWSAHDSFGHVDLELWKYSSDHTIKQSFSISLKTVKEEKCNEEYCMKDFEKGYDWHTFHRFIPKSELTRRRLELVPEDALTIVCTMKNTSTASVKEEVPTAEVNNSAKSQVSGSSQAGTTTMKKSVLKCITENSKVPSKGKKRKTETENDGLGISEFSISPHEKKVLHDFKKSFLQNEDSDVVIKVKGSEFPAHRFVLKARSPVFAATFRHNMKESATGIVEIEDCDPSYFLDFLCFLYCGDVTMISKENTFSLFILADKYEVLDLKEMCLDFMKKNITIDIFCETITLALQHSETELISLATDFFVKNAEEILQTVKWQIFAAENPTQCNELFIKFVRSVKH